MQKKYKTIIFDLDGTLLNTLEDLHTSANYALQNCGMPERSLEEIRHFVGNGVQRLMELSVPEGTSKEKQEEAFSIFKEHYALHCNDKTDLYPGVAKLLEQLKKEEFRIAIVSNKLQEGVDTLFRQYFKDTVEIAIGVREGLHKKPAPDSVYEAMEQLHSQKEETVYVGDSEVDIATAQNAGLPCINVTWGFRTRQEQEKAGGILFANTPKELKELLYKE